MNSPPLEGVRVVELAVWHAGPGAAAILGDLGAEVIKIESPRGDPERYGQGSRTLRTGAVDLPQWNVLFDVSNRNKSSVVLDLHDPEDLALLSRLVSDADVFLTNLRVDTRRALGVDYEGVRAWRPDIVYVDVSGYGSSGPFAGDGAFDRSAQAASGLLFLQGDEPVPLPAALLDQVTAITASHGAVTALFARERTGRGQEVSTSIYGAAIWMLHLQLAATAALGHGADVSWDRRRKSPLLTTYQCRDGRWIMGTNVRPSVWPAFLAIVGRPDLLDAWDGGSETGLESLFAELDAAFLTRDARDWVDAFRAEGLMFALAQTFADVLVDPQARANGYVADFEHPVLGSVPLPGYPIRFGGAKVGMSSSAALQPGADNDRVLPGLRTRAACAEAPTGP